MGKTESNQTGRYNFWVLGKRYLACKIHPSVLQENEEDVKIEVFTCGNYRTSLGVFPNIGKAKDYLREKARIKTTY